MNGKNLHDIFKICPGVIDEITFVTLETIKPNLIYRFLGKFHGAGRV